MGKYKGINMTEAKLKKLILSYDETAELKKDNPKEFRIFLFSKLKRYAITNAIDKKDDWKIIRISEYDPILPTHPAIVIHLQRLYLKKEYHKT